VDCADARDMLALLCVRFFILGLPAVAAVLRLTVPPSLLSRADEIIE